VQSWVECSRENHLSALIDSVKGGSPILIVDAGRPVARFESVHDLRPDDDARLARLVRDGIERRNWSVQLRSRASNENGRSTNQRRRTLSSDCSKLAHAWPEVDPSDSI
jgi:antitoxin (DNA-binding transcriptional repressor) of toxin-antitoxin stability system